MKHFSKIVLGSVLSVAMALSAGIASANYKKVSAYEVPTTVQTSSIVENIEVENGKATYVVNKKQVAGSSTYTGIRLVGRGNAVFNLGTIDLKDASYWNGPDHAPKTGEGAYDTNHYTAEGVDYKSFISFVYDPFVDGHKNLGTTSAKYTAELGAFDVTLTSIANPTEYVTVRVNQGLREDANNAIGMQAMGKNNDNRYGERYRYFDQPSKEEGISFETASKSVDALGNQVAPVELAYDSGAVYSPTTLNADGLRGAYCIRNFSNDKEDYIVADQAKHTPWAGFTAAADGSIKVKVEVKFVVVNTVNSKINESAIIVTSFNGYDFSKETQTLKTSDYVEELSYNLSNVGKGKVEINAPVAKHINGFSKVAIPNSYAKIYVEGNEANADTLTFTEDSAIYNFTEDGEFIFDFYNDTGVKIGSQTITVAETAITNETINVKTTSGKVELVTEAQSRFTNVNYTGLKLTGGEYATFDLGTIDLAKSNWEGTATSITGAYESCFDFVFAPTSDITIKEKELNQFTIRLTDVNDVNNYVDITVWPRDSGFEWVYAINTKAVGQSKDGAFRNKATPTLITSPFVTKSSINATTASVLGLDDAVTMYPNGDSVKAFPLVFDIDDNALYSPVTYASGELATSYAIRDYDEAYDVNDAAWAGFSKDDNGCALVNVSLTFNTLGYGEETSIIVTKLGEYDFSKGNTVDANEVTVTASDKNLQFAKVNKEYTIYAPVNEHVVLNSFVSESKAVIKQGEEIVDTVEFTSWTAGYTFANAGVYTIEFQDKDGAQIGDAITVNVNDGVGVISAISGGKAYYKRGDAEKVEITDTTILKAGDVITVEGGVHELTGDAILDVRSFVVNGEEKATIVENVATQIDGFSYVVTQTDVDKDVFNLTVKLDNYCDVTFIDEYVTENVVSYAWQSNGEVSFPYGSSKNPAIYTGASDDGAALIGYERKNAEGYKNGAETCYTMWRSYDNKIGKDSNDSDTNLEQYECLTKGMVFEALYLKAEIISEYNAETKKLSIYLAVEQAGADKWNAVISPTGEKAKLNLGYLVTDKTTSEPIYSPSCTTLGVYQVGGAYVPLVNGKYVYALGDVAIEEGKNLQITGYAGLSTAQGGVTAGIAHKNTTYVKEAQNKIANAGILSSEAGNGYLYAVNVGGVNKYSKLTLTDLQGLYTYAGDTTTITAWVNE